MKIGIKQLRKIIRETIESIDEASTRLHVPIYRTRIEKTPGGQGYQEWVNHILKNIQDPSDRKYYLDDPEGGQYTIEMDNGDVITSNDDTIHEEVDIWTPGSGWTYDVPVGKLIKRGYDLPIYDGRIDLDATDNLPKKP